MLLLGRLKSLAHLVSLVALSTAILTASRSAPASGAEPLLDARTYAARSVVTSAGLPGVILLEGGWRTGSGSLTSAPPLQMSLDQGTTWAPLGAPPTQNPTWNSGVAAVALAPRGDVTQPVRVFYADHIHGVLYRSGDSGRTWAATTFPLLHDCVEPFSVVVAGVQSDPQRLYARDSCVTYRTWTFGERPLDGQLFTLAEAYFVSQDAGLSWQQSSPVFSGGGVGGTEPWPVVWWRPSPADPQRLYDLRPLGWSVSSDGGTTWMPLGGAALASGYLVLTATDAQRLIHYDFDVTGALVVAQRTTDGGATWETLPLPACAVAESRLAASHVTSGALALACGADLYTSLNDGVTWSPRGTLPPVVASPETLPFELNADASGPDRVLITRGGALYALDFANGPLQPLSVSRQYPTFLPQMQR